MTRHVVLKCKKSFSVCLLRNNGWYRKYMWKSLSKMERVFGIKPKIVFGDSSYLFHDLSVQFGRNLFSDLSRDTFPISQRLWLIDYDSDEIKIHSYTLCFEFLFHSRFRIWLAHRHNPSHGKATCTKVVFFLKKTVAKI